MSRHFLPSQRWCCFLVFCRHCRRRLLDILVLASVLFLLLLPCYTTATVLIRRRLRSRSRRSSNSSSSSSSSTSSSSTARTLEEAPTECTWRFRGLQQEFPCLVLQHHSLSPLKRHAIKPQGLEHRTRNPQHMRKPKEANTPS